MASNAKDTLIRRISGTPGKGTGSNTGLGTADIVVPQFPLLPDRLTKETAAQFRDEVDRWRAGLQAQFPVPQSSSGTSAGSTGTGSSTGSGSSSVSITNLVTNDQFTTTINSILNSIENVTNNIVSTSITPRSFTIFGKATSNPVIYDGTQNVEFNVRTLSVTPSDIALSTGSFIVGSVGEIGVDTQKSDIPLSGFGAAANDVSLGGYKITNLFAPSNPTDAANKAYVDSIPHINIYNTNGALTGDRTLDGNGKQLVITNPSAISIDATSDISIAAGSGTLLLHSVSGDVDIASQAAAGSVFISAPGNLFVKTPLVMSGSAGSNTFLKLIDPVNGTAEFSSIPAPANIYNSNGTLTGHRTVTGAGYNIYFSGSPSIQINATSSIPLTAPAVNITASTSSQITSPFITFATGGALDLFFAASTAGGTTSDYILGINPSNGQIRYTTTTIASLSGGGGSGTVSGTTGKIAKFTSSTAVGNSILTESGTVVEAAGAISVTDSYQISGAYIVSWNNSYGNAVFGTRPSAWASMSGSGNTAIGNEALFGLTSGSKNTALGRGALRANSTAIENVAVGWNALYANVTGGDCTAIGMSTLSTQTGASFNTAVGAYACNLTTSATHNTGIGFYALQANTTGGYNTSLGDSGLSACTTGTENTAVGALSTASMTVGSRNTAVGYGTLSGLLTGTNNNNVVLGHSAGSYLTSGSSNIIIGYTSQAASTTGSNQLVIGNLIYGTGLDGTNNTISSGNIGIGVKAPACKLDVNGAVQSTYQRFGSGSPEGAVTAPVGAFYSRTDGGAGTSFYVKESGTGNTGWVAK